MANDHFEEEWRRAFEGAELPPDPQVWKGIAAHIRPVPWYRRLRVWLWFFGLISLGLLVWLWHKPPANLAAVRPSKPVADTTSRGAWDRLRTASNDRAGIPPSQPTAPPIQEAPIAPSPVPATSSPAHIRTPNTPASVVPISPDRSSTSQLPVPGIIIRDSTATGVHRLSPSAIDPGLTAARLVQASPNQVQTADSLPSEDMARTAGLTDSLAAVQALSLMPTRDSFDTKMSEKVAEWSPKRPVLTRKSGFHLLIGTGAFQSGTNWNTDYQAYLNEYLTTHQARDLDAREFFGQLRQQGGTRYSWMLSMQGEWHQGWLRVRGGLQYFEQLIDLQTNAYYINRQEGAGYLLLESMLNRRMTDPGLLQALRNQPFYQPGRVNSVQLQHVNTNAQLRDENITWTSRDQVLSIPVQVGVSTKVWKKWHTSLYGGMAWEYAWNTSGQVSHDAVHFSNPVLFASTRQTALLSWQWSWQVHDRQAIFGEWGYRQPLNAPVALPYVQWSNRQQTWLIGWKYDF